MVGTTQLTWKATGVNNATASVTFEVVVSADSSPPATAPTVSRIRQHTDGLGLHKASVIWGSLPGITDYMLQVKESSGDFPSVATDSGPYAGTYVTHRGPPGNPYHAFVGPLRPGTYVGRVAAVNDSGPGPWSEEFDITIS